MEKISKNILNVAITGSLETDTGQKTSTLIEQIESLKDINIRAVYNKDIKEAELILKKANLIEKFEYINNLNALKKSKAENIITDNLEIFLGIENIDVAIVTEVDTKIAVDVIYKSLKSRTSVININAVSEVTLGLLFKNLASSNNVIYSVGAGDEPAATLDLINFCEKLGLDIICAGKGKNNPLNIYCTPDDFIEKGKQIKVSPRSIASFVDGTKTMLEMAILSNATGIPLDKDGMHGPKVNVADLIKTFNLKENGGILYNIPVIDYVIGDIAPGVFVVFTSKQESIINELKYLKMGDGPNFVLYKPYHLGNIESPLSVYDVVLKGKPTLTVKDRMITAVVARAKKDLRKGDFIDSIGGYTLSGLAINYKEMIEKKYVPLGLVEDSRVKKDIIKDEIISFKSIECDPCNIIFELWNKQIKLF
ncbi:hypothetical protein ES707_18469 [subsurface metagenome]